MKKFKEPDRNQQLLFAEVDLNSIVEKDSPAYIIDHLVNKLDTTAIEKKYNMEIWQGKDPLHPKTYIKVCLLAIHNCRFSLRKMEQDTKANLIYRWLTGDKAMDHSSIGKFLNKFKKEITDLFSQIILIAKEEKLMDFDLLAIDTVKIRANASYKNSRTLKSIKESKKKIKKQLAELIDKTDRLEEKERSALKKRNKRLTDAEKKLKERMAESGETKINTTDFDCKILQQANGEKNPGYAITTSADTKSDIITHFQVDSNSSDNQKLMSVIEGSQVAAGQVHKIIIADSGFSSIDNLQKLDEANQDALIPDQRLKVEALDQTSKGKYDRSNFKYFPMHDYYRCPEKTKLTILTENTKEDYKIYANQKACKNCPVKNSCTKAEYRTIRRSNKEYLKEKMRSRFKKKRNIKKYKKRAHSAESPYGDIKHNKKFRIFHRRGLEKVKLETSMIFLLHNIMKIGKQLCLT